MLSSLFAHQEPPRCHFNLEMVRHDKNKYDMLQEASLTIIIARSKAVQYCRLWDRVGKKPLKVETYIPRLLKFVNGKPYMMEKWAVGIAKVKHKTLVQEAYQALAEYYRSDGTVRMRVQHKILDNGRGMMMRGISYPQLEKCR